MNILSDLKDCLVPPYHYDENGNKVRENFIETYFDISSAEVKSAGYASGKRLPFKIAMS